MPQLRISVRHARRVKNKGRSCVFFFFKTKTSLFVFGTTCGAAAPALIPPPALCRLIRSPLWLRDSGRPLRLNRSIPTVFARAYYACDKARGCERTREILIIRRGGGDMRANGSGGATGMDKLSSLEMSEPGGGEGVAAGGAIGLFSLLPMQTGRPACALRVNAQSSP